MYIYLLNLLQTSVEKRAVIFLSRIIKNPNVKNDFDYQNWNFAIKVEKF